MRKIAICIPRNDKEEILLQKKTIDYSQPGVWTPFGGEMESEDSKKEILRELKEEIGFEPLVEFCFDMEIDFMNDKEMVYVFTTTLNDTSKISLNEGAGFAFFSREEVDGLKKGVDCDSILNKFFEYIDNGKI